MSLTTLLLISSLLISGCAIDEMILDNDTGSTITVVESDAPVIEEVQEEQETQQKRDYFERLTESKGLGIFDFNELTADNCDNTLFTFRRDFGNIRDDIEELKEDVEDEARDVQEAQKALEEAERLDDEKLINDRDRDLKEQEADLENAEDNLEDMEDLQDKYRIVTKEMDIACLRLKTHSGNI